MMHLSRRRTAWCAILAVLGPAGAAAATTEDLPADRIVFDSNRQDPGDTVKNYEIFIMGADGSALRRLTSDDRYDSWWPRPSPDRRRILFVRTPAGVHDRDYRQVSTWIMQADGTGLREILRRGAHGWSIQGHPEWSPDGTRIATMGGRSSNSQIYVVRADGSAPFKVTGGPKGPERGGMNLDPSWSPDGRQLLFVGCPSAFCLPRLQEVYRVNLDGSGLERLTRDRITDNDPYYSPDGRTIAWLRNTGGRAQLRWGIYRMDADGTGKRPVIDDGWINSKPAWSSDGRRIWFHRTSALGEPFNVWSIDAPGSGLAPTIEPPPNGYDNEYPAVVH